VVFLPGNLCLDLIISGISALYIAVSQERRTCVGGGKLELNLESLALAISYSLNYDTPSTIANLDKHNLCIFKARLWAPIGPFEAAQTSKDLSLWW
jgi:hypothetical protein